MTQIEFKEILESIEEGLYDKWEANFKVDPVNKTANPKEWVEGKPNHELLHDAFFWFDTLEKSDFWEDVNELFIEIRNEKNLD